MVIQQDNRRYSSDPMRLAGQSVNSFNAKPQASLPRFRLRLAVKRNY